MMEEMKNLPPAEVSPDVEDGMQQAAPAPECHISLREVRRLRMEAKKAPVSDTPRLGEDFWAIRFPTARGLAKAARNVLCAPFNLVAAPMGALRRHMWQQSFFEAVRQCDTRLAAEALEAGANISAEKERAFLTAVYANDVDMARLLYTHGADVNFGGGMPIMLAALAGHAEMAECLLHDLKASPDTSIFGEVPHDAPVGAELMTVLSAGFGIDCRNPVHDVLKNAGIRPVLHIGYYNRFMYETNARLRAQEAIAGKIAFADKTVLYLDPAKKSASDKVNPQAFGRSAPRAPRPLPTLTPPGGTR